MPKFDLKKAIITGGDIENLINSDYDAEEEGIKIENKTSEEKFIPLLAICEFCDFEEKKYKTLKHHLKFCKIRIEVKESGKYILDYPDLGKIFLTGAGKVALAIRNNQSNEDWLKSLEKQNKQTKGRYVEEIENAKGLIEFENKNKIRFKYSDTELNNFVIEAMEDN